MASTHNVPVRAIRHAEANDRVGRNAASFVKPPQGKTGRPSRAMTAAEAAALLTAANNDPRLGAYAILSLTTGIRTEEARALRWDHVDLDGNPAARLPVPPHIAVWRSVRLHGDTKTEKSRRTGTTETIYRHELRPVITTGTDVMDKIFTAAQHQG
jgi:integrase